MEFKINDFFIEISVSEILYDTDNCNNNNNHYRVRFFFNFKIIETLLEGYMYTKVPTNTVPLEICQTMIFN